MKTYVATISKKGQITIPVELRRLMRISTPGKGAFIVDGDTVRMEPLPFRTVASMVGIAGSLEQSLTWYEMIEIAYEDHAAAKGFVLRE